MPFFGTVTETYTKETYTKRFNAALWIFPAKHARRWSGVLDFFPRFTDKGLYEEFSNVKGSDIEWQYLCQNSSPYVPVSKYEFKKTLVLSQLSDLEFPIRQGLI